MIVCEILQILNPHKEKKLMLTISIYFDLLYFFHECF